MAGRTQKLEKNAHGLTDQQVLFCREYAKSLNLGQAYEAANYKFSSRNNRDSMAARLSRSVKIQNYLREVMNLDEVSVINAVAAIALTPITEVVQWDGKELLVKQTDLWSERAKLAVKKIKTTKKIRSTPEGDETTVETEIEMYDRLSALDKLMRKLKLYPKHASAIEWLDEGVKLGLIPSSIEESAVEGINDVMQKTRSAIGGETQAQSKPGLSQQTIEQIKRSVLGIET